MKMIKSKEFVSNPFYTKDEYENFLEEVIANAEEDDFPIQVEPVFIPTGLLPLYDTRNIEEMIERDTGLHASVQCPTCPCCGKILMNLIIYR